MSKSYKVKVSSVLNIRSAPNTTSAVLGQMPNGTLITSDTEANGWAHFTWNSISGYASMQYLTLIGVNKSELGNTQPASTNPPAADNQTANGMTAAEYANYVSANSNDNAKKLFTSYIRSFGCPPQFNKWVDIQYETDDGLAPGVGRRIAESFFVNPSILSLCPGTVNYLPGFTSKEEDQFFNKIKAEAAGIANFESGPLSGKLYEFKSAYVDYINTVNLMCRATSIYMGIGDINMPGSTIKLKHFDYGYWTTPEGSTRTNSGVLPLLGSIYEEAKRVVSSLVTDNTYIHFFITHQGTSVNESIDTSTSSSDIENVFNSSNLHRMSRNLEFLFGGPADSTLENTLNGIIDTAGSSSDFIKQFGTAAKNYLTKGGRIIFPQMIDNVGYNKSLSAALKFVSPYGDKLSIFLRCYVPTIHLLALSLPKQLSSNMYTYPFLVRAFQPGYCNFDLAVISNLRITRGGNDNTSWTIDSLPTEVEVNFDITPLYTNLMSSSAAHPISFMQNTSLAEYLATMCGVDMKANNFWTKYDLAMMSLGRKVPDTITNLARSLTDSKLTNGIRKFTQIIN
jgi:hypothetical protein